MTSEPFSKLHFTCTLPNIQLYMCAISDSIATKLYYFQRIACDEAYNKTSYAKWHIYVPNYISNQTGDASTMHN